MQEGTLLTTGELVQVTNQTRYVGDDKNILQIMVVHSDGSESWQYSDDIEVN